MGLIPTSVIKNYAEAAGHSSLDEESLLVLSRECEYKLRYLLQEARKYMQHSRRSKLTIEDVNSALGRQLGEQPVLGYDGLEALQYKPVSGAQVSGVTASALPPAGTLWVVPQEEVSLEDVLMEPLPKAPAPVTLTGHWLAIEGVQPQIPENPNIHDRLKVNQNQQQPSADSVEKMLQEPSSVFGPVPRKTVLEEAEVKPLVKHVLSKEHQLYFDTVTADLLSGTDNKVEGAIVALGRDAGLQQLVPYFIQFVGELVPKNLRDPSKLLLLVRILEALFGNEHLLLEPYLHQMMPPALTCIVGKRLCEDPERDSRHWRLREEASGLVAAILARYASVYHTLLPRTVKTLSKALLGSGEEPPCLTSQYGAIVAFSLIGGHCVETVVLPHASAIQEAAQKTGGACAQMLLNALNNALSKISNNN